MSRRTTIEGKRTILWAAIAVLALTLIACGSSGEERPGTLRIRLTDAPVDELTQVNVSIRALAIKPVAGEVERFPVENGQVDLLALRDTATLLASKDVRPGKYEYLVMELDRTGASVVDRDEVEHPLQVSRHEIRISRSAFQVSEGGRTSILLDFDAAGSVLDTSSGWLLSPVVQVASVQTSAGAGS